MVTKETIIISLGGSLVAPDQIDIRFLKDFKKVLKKYFLKKRFLIFVGGGKTARIYQKALLEFGADNDSRDWIGINVTRLNAEIVKQVFEGFVYKEVIKTPNTKISTRKEVLIAGGWKPGWSTDYCAVTMAKNYGIKTIVNLSNIDYAYDKDPSKFSDAKIIKEINWKDFRKIVGSKWTPGMSAPFDPKASKMAEILKIKVAIINGKKLDQLENFLNSKPFTGTIIK
jgi:uridylate kinase